MSMKMYSGDFVSENLSIPIPEVEGFRDLLGLALRVNKKRAHLLVSNVLGKHVPQKPSVILQAVHSLATQISHHRAGRDLTAEIRSQLVRDLVTSMESNSTPPRLVSTESHSDLTVFGYAETATGMGAALAYFLDASYIHSTRYPHDEASYGSFDEEHSHATSHAITPRDWSMLNDPARTIVLTDDELSTGKTVMNTIRLLESHAHHDEYYVATLTDLRTAASHEVFRAFEAEMNVRVTVVSLIATELAVPASALAEADALLSTLPPQAVLDRTEPGTVSLVKLTEPTYPLSLGRSGTQMALMADQASRAAQRVTVDEPLLVLGVEENMFFPLMAAYELELAGHDMLFSSATQSPVIAQDLDSYAIRDALTYTVDGGNRRFAYNVGNHFAQIAVFMEDSGNTLRNAELIAALQTRTASVIVVEQDQIVLDAPLVGPDFGSYSPTDVRWLLKDLSHAELEAGTEEREEAIQSGSAHYAESLPVEYVPTEEYQNLFLASLEDNKHRLAEAVAFVGEQIYAARNAQPVLVSLARAGTPVGVLVKRYLEAAYSYTAPHYAVSIVRGRGIDRNALSYLASHYDPARIMFVDGWTGKGAITKELADALDAFEAETQVRFDPTLAVLADPGSCVELYGTRDDYLIPSACLNSTVSGLVSRTVFNTLYTGPADYHGAKFYRDFIPNDVSNHFVNAVSELFTPDLAASAQLRLAAHVVAPPSWAGWRSVEQLSEEYGIHDVNLVKPGVGETTRVLLRRVPWKVLVRPQDRPQLRHILMLAEQRGVRVEDRADLPYACVGLIHPRYTKGATGADGRAVL